MNEENILEDRQYLTPEQLSDMLNISLSTIEKWRFNGNVKIPFIKLGRIIRYRVDDVHQFLEDNIVHRDK